MAERTFLQKIRLGVVAVVAVLMLVLVMQNQESVVTRVYFWRLEMPRFVLLGTVFLVGAFAGYLTGRGARTRRGRD